MDYSHLRAELLHPAALRRRRERADVAFLPLGELEWHGIHGPIGTDGVKAHHICCAAAEKLGGGVVFPAMYFGTPRDSFHMDGRAEVIAAAADAYGIDQSVLRGAGPHGGMDIQQQWIFYQRLLRMALEQIAGFGFRSIYICSGHGPLMHFVRPVAVAFSRAAAMAGRAVTTDWALESEPCGMRGDHAGKWETSIMMAIEPSSVDLQQIERHPHLKGIGAGLDAIDSTREQGERFIDAAADAIAKEARWLIDHYPQLPPRHRHRR